MGNSFEADKKLKETQARWAREAEEAENKFRMALADKIVLAVVDKISNDIIRPGPKPEERECYVMAQELRDTSKELSVLVAEILRIEEIES